jgi:hypothetical protein
VNRDGSGALHDAAREPDLEHGDEVGVLVDVDVIAPLLAGDQVREEHHLIQRQLAVAGRHSPAAILGQVQALVAVEGIFENRAILGDDPD